MMHGQKNIMSSTCFEHPSVYLQEDFYMQFYGFPFMYPCKQSGRRQDVLDTWYQVSFIKYQAQPAIDQTAYTVTRKKYQKTACTSLPEDDHLVVRNMSKTL